MKITGLVSTLQTQNLDSSITFYTQLGFDLEWKWPEDAPTHASLSSSGFSFMLEKIKIDQKPDKADLYFKVEGVENLHQTLKEKSFPVGDLQKTDYGMLDFSLNSPSGHHLTFGEPSGEYQS